MLWKDFLQDYARMNHTSSLYYCSPVFQIACEDFEAFFLTMIEKAHIYEGITYQDILDDYLRVILQYPPRKHYVSDFHHFCRFHCGDTTTTEEIIEVVIRKLMEKGAILRTEWILAPGDYSTYNIKGYLIDVFSAHIPEIQNIDWTTVGKFSYSSVEGFIKHNTLLRQLGMPESPLRDIHPNGRNASSLDDFIHWSILTANSIILTNLYLNANVIPYYKNGQSFIKTEDRSASAISAASCIS